MSYYHKYLKLKNQKGGFKCKIDYKQCNITNYNCLDFDILRDIGASNTNKQFYCFNKLGENPQKK